MAELILTDDEQAALQWMDLDDEALGKYVRYNVAMIREHFDLTDPDKVMKVIPLVLALMEFPLKANSTTMTLTAEGCYHGDTQLGDWRLTLERLDS